MSHLLLGLGRGAFFFGSACLLFLVYLVLWPALGLASK